VTRAQPRTLLFLALACLPALGAAESPAERIHATLAQLAREHHVCAAAVAILRHTAVASTDVATGCDAVRLPDGEAVFEAASLGKPVFAYGVVRLVKQGRLDLDAPLLRYLPQGYAHIQDPFDDAHPPVTDLVTAPELRSVTARILLQHTSGLPNWADGPLAFDFVPGARWRYSGEGYVLLQRAVEAITGAPLDAFMRTEVFEPLGMTLSDYTWNARFEPLFVAGRSANGAPVQAKPFHAPIAAASLYTTAGDYAKFLSALLHDGSALDAIVGAPAHVDERLGLAWGLGWGIEEGPDDRFIWHWGSNPGYRAFVMASLRSGDGVVILTDSDGGLALAKPIVSAVLPGEHAAFDFYMLHDGFDRILCKLIRWCS
jgi:CubicO group peptidase (beta-lactamase class C family)